jgi:hypothetical protein
MQYDPLPFHIDGRLRVNRQGYREGIAEGRLELLEQLEAGTELLVQRCPGHWRQFGQGV